MASPISENETAGNRNRLSLYSNYIWNRLHGFYVFSSSNFKGTLSNLREFASVFRSRKRWECFPLPLSSRILCKPSRVHCALEDVFEHVLKILHSIEKDIKFWEYTAERSDTSKSYFMILERGPRAFIDETFYLLRGHGAYGSSTQQLSESACIYVEDRLTILTKLRNSLAVFLAQVYIEVNNIGEELAKDPERKLPSLWGTMKDSFSRLEESVRHLHANHQSNSSIDGTYSSPPLFDNMPEINQDGSQLTDREIRDAIDWLYRNLHQLDNCISILVTKHKKPRKITQYWINYSCGGVGLSVCSLWLLRHSRLMGNSDIDNWIQDAKDSTIGFYTEHVEKPVYAVAISMQLLSIMEEHFETFHKKHEGMMEQEEVQLSSNSLHRAMLELNQIQRANEINFAILAALPAFSLSLLLMMGVRAWFKQGKKAEGRDKIARLQRRLLLVEVEKNIMLCQHFAERGEVKDAQYMFGSVLYRLNRLCHSVRGSAEASGEWQDVQEDIILLASPNLPTAQKVRVVVRLLEYDCLLPA